MVKTSPHRIILSNEYIVLFTIYIPFQTKIERQTSSQKKRQQALSVSTVASSRFLDAFNLNYTS